MSLLQDYQLDTEAKKALVYYKGTFNQDTLLRISNYLRDGLPTHRKISKKIFSIFIELAQNISKYSAEHNQFLDIEDKNGIGVIAIYQFGSDYILKGGNLVNSTTAVKLKQHCHEINQLDYHGLKRLRKELNSQPLEDNATGGKIGLLQIALKSEHPIEVNYTTQPNNNSMAFVVISTKVTEEIAAAKLK